MAENAGFAAIRNVLAGPDYRNYAVGSLCSHVGTWVQRVALGWLTWELTESGTWLGIIAFAEMAPTVVAVDTTVQEKAVYCPTDVRLCQRSTRRLGDVGRQTGRGATSKLRPQKQTGFVHGQPLRGGAANEAGSKED